MNDGLLPANDHVPPDDGDESAAQPDDARDAAAADDLGEIIGGDDMPPDASAHAETADDEPDLDQVNRIYFDAVAALWRPRPSHTLDDTKLFKAGLTCNGRRVADGDLTFHLALADAGEAHRARSAAMRSRSHADHQGVFWIAAADPTIAEAVETVYRAQRDLAATADDDATARDAAEAQRESVWARLVDLLERAFLGGMIFFHGEDFSPETNAGTVSQNANRLLVKILPVVFNRFPEAGAQVRSSDLAALVEAATLAELPPVYRALSLLTETEADDDGWRFACERAPLAEVLGRITAATSYGDTAAGRDLVEFFARAPFGWNPEVVQMLTGCLLRAGQIEATSGGRVIQDALTIEARATLTQDAAFRLASFRPRVGVEFTHLMAAVESFRTVFGREVPEMEPVTVAGSIRSALDQHEFDVQQALGVLLAYDLPGAPALQEALDDLRSLRSGSEEQVILGFNQNHRRLKEVIARAASLNSTLHGRHLQLLRRAKDFLIHVWPMLRREADLSERYRTQADTLQDLIDRDTFYRELPMIGDLVDGLEAEYRRRRDMAAWARADVYASALRALRAFSDWRRLEPAQQHRVAEPLQRRSRPEVAGMISIELLRADIDACPARLRQAIDALLALRGDEARDATLDIRRVVPPRIDDPAALDAALNSLHEACKALLDAGKRVHLR